MNNPRRIQFTNGNLTLYVYGDAGLNASAQPYKYNGKELDRMHGLDWYDYGARDYDAALAQWTKMDRYCEKYYHTSPYVYCVENPMKSIDVYGDSCLILLAPYGARGAGHMAIAIQNESKKWDLYSKNGTKEYLGILGKEGPAGFDKRNNRWIPRDMEDSLQQLFQDKFINPTDNGKNPNMPNNAPEYAEGYLLPTTPEQDKKMQDGALEIINKDYNVFSSNCAQTVQNALRRAGLNP